jgi:hypothetical protein
MKEVQVESVPLKPGKQLMEQSEHRRNLKKIELAADCKISSTVLASSMEFSISSDSTEKCKLASFLIKYTIDSLSGHSPVQINASDNSHHMVLHSVPSLYLPVILGKNQAFISSLEEELGVVVFIADDKEVSVSNARKHPSIINPPGMTAMLATDGDILIKKPNLGITGISNFLAFSHSIKNLVAFKLKLMTLIETKMKGLYTGFGHQLDLTHTPQMHYNVPGFAIDTYPIAEEELSLALGKQGANRRRIATVSGCAVEYIGSVAFFYGDLVERQIARNLLGIVLERGRGTFSVSRWRGMMGVDSIEFPQEQSSWLTGRQGVGLHQIEDSCNVICFVDGPSKSEGKRGKLSQLLPPVPRPDNQRQTSNESSKSVGTMMILGLDRNTQTAARLINEKLNSKYGSNNATPALSRESSAEEVSLELFAKLFRSPGRPNRIMMTEQTVPNQSNRLHGAIFEGIQGILRTPNSTVAKMEDLTVLEIPAFFFTNTTQSLLKQIEDEYNVLSGYVQYGSDTDNSFIVIIGPLRPRRAAELKLMATIEQKFKGFYSYGQVRDGQRVMDRPWFVSNPDFDTDTYPISEENLSFALGNKGSIRKKLAVASGCTIEYVGETAYLSGTIEERTRGRDYLRWVLQQLDGEVSVGDFSKRSDISSIQLTKRAAGFVNGNKGRVLRTVEELTGTFCFIGRAHGDARPLLVCGQDANRDAAVFLLEKYINQYQANDWSDDANDASGSSEMSKSNLEEVLKANNLYVRPREPWKVGSNQRGKYIWICQPGPGAARQDAELLSMTDKSSVLIRSDSKKEKSPKKASEFVNDSSSFPELAGKGNSRVNSPVLSPKAAPPPPPVVEETTGDAGVYIDRVKSQIWGDWGLGPNGDPEASKSMKSSGTSGQNWPGLTGSPKPKLIGAWK